MKRFAELVERLAQAPTTDQKVRYLTEYFNNVPGEDKIWAIALLTGRCPKRIVSNELLRQWVETSSLLPTWLFEESLRVAGDVAETVALLSPSSDHHDIQSLSHRIQDIIELHGQPENKKQKMIMEAWSQMAYEEKWVFNKLITGGFRPVISINILAQAFADITSQDVEILLYKINQNWNPQNITYEHLLLKKSKEAEKAKPYPFMIPGKLRKNINSLGPVGDWQVEWIWRGISCQVVLHGGHLNIWSSKGDLLTRKLPEFQPLIQLLENGTVIEGQLFSLKDGMPVAKAHLMSRLQRKNTTKKLMSDIPVVLIAYDLLEYKGKDIRALPLTERRELLESIVIKAATPVLTISQVLDVESWQNVEDEHAACRMQHAMGIIFKKKTGLYQEGTIKDHCLVWPAHPMCVRAILIYSNGGSEFTFSVWKNDELIPFTKANKGLNTTELQEVNQFVQENIIEKFGPVRSVAPQLVFEIAFEGIELSKRHKSGVVLTRPRIQRWLKEANAENAETLEDLLKLLAQ